MYHYDLTGADDEQEASEGGASQRGDPSELFTATIDIRKFAQFLVGQQVNPVRVIYSE